MDSLFQMLANAADGAFVVNPNQTIVYWNQAAQKILGYAPNRTVGSMCYDVVRGCNEKGQPVCRRRCRIMQAALAGKAVRDYDLVACTQTGKTRWINISILAASAVNNSDSTLIIHLFRDATQSKQNEQLINQMFSAAEKQSPPDISPARTPRPDTPHLTRREREVLSLLVAGLTTREISDSLSISPSTVRNHIQNVLHNLQVHSRLEAVVYALEHGLID